MKLAIGAITRRRPDAFARLLDSFAKMDHPEGCEMIFCFAENDDALSVEQITREFATRTGLPAEVRLEPRKGIPLARNKVLDMALEAEADYLTFVDDDETVTKNWLVQLYGTARARALDLTGGPVSHRADAEDEDLTTMQRGVLRHFRERLNRRADNRRGLAEAGDDGWVNIYTNNWCARLAFVRAHGIRFDETMRFTGGSDTRFSVEMKEAGARIGWAPEAYVEEYLPLYRLTPGYHYRRSRDQASNSVQLGTWPAGKALRTVPRRLLEGTLDMISVPFRGNYAIAKGLFKYGLAVGFVRGAIGMRSRHYKHEATPTK